MRSIILTSLIVCSIAESALAQSKCFCATKTDDQLQVRIVNGGKDLDILHNGEAIYSTWGDETPRPKPESTVMSCGKIRSSARLIVYRMNRTVFIYSAEKLTSGNWKLRKYVYSIKPNDATSFSRVTASSNSDGRNSNSDNDAVSIHYQGKNPPPVDMQICWNFKSLEWGRVNKKALWRNSQTDPCDQYELEFKDGYHKVFNDLSKANQRPTPLPPDWSSCEPN